MKSEEIDNSCTQTVKYINATFENLKVQIEQYKQEKKIAEQRAKVAESTLEKFKTDAQEEIKKAYQAGLNSNYDTSSGGPKLVFSKN